jgi:hypothetical protein
MMCTCCWAKGEFGAQPGEGVVEEQVITLVEMFGCCGTKTLESARARPQRRRPVLNDSEKVGCGDIAGAGEGQVERISRDDDAAQHRVAQYHELASPFASQGVDSPLRETSVALAAHNVDEPVGVLAPQRAVDGPDPDVGPQLRLAQSCLPA